MLRTLKVGVQFVGSGIDMVTGSGHVLTDCVVGGGGCDAVALGCYQMIGIGDGWELGLVTWIVVRLD